MVALEEAEEFISGLPEKARAKVLANIRKIRFGVRDAELFKKLDGTDIWEFRTLYEGIAYRLFAFWDKDTETLVVATHGLVKKTQKTPKREIRHAQEIKKEYFNSKRQ